MSLSAAGHNLPGHQAGEHPAGLPRAHRPDRLRTKQGVSSSREGKSATWGALVQPFDPLADSAASLFVFVFSLFLPLCCSPTFFFLSLGAFSPSFLLASEAAEGEEGDIYLFKGDTGTLGAIFVGSCTTGMSCVHKWRIFVPGFLKYCCNWGGANVDGSIELLSNNA